MGRKRHSAKEIVNKLRQAIVELAKGQSVWGVSSDDVLERLAWLMVTRGVHAHIRRDNGSEFTAGVVREWLGKIGVRTLYIEPGSPWKKGDVESFNRKLRAELLTGEIFYTSNQCGGVDRGTLPDRSFVRIGRSTFDRS